MGRRETFRSLAAYWSWPASTAPNFDWTPITSGTMSKETQFSQVEKNLRMSMRAWNP
jgi:hypothetical protein